jgi:hypothetical protein
MPNTIGAVRQVDPFMTPGQRQSHGGEPVDRAYQRPSMIRNAPVMPACAAQEGSIDGVGGLVIRPDHFLEAAGLFCHCAITISWYLQAVLPWGWSSLVRPKTS